MGMADGLEILALRRSKFGEAFRASLLRLLLKQKQPYEFLKPSRSRTFPWYLALLRIALEGSLRPCRLPSKVHADDETQRLAREVLGIMRELVSDHEIIPPAAQTVRTLRRSLGSPSLYEAVAHRVIAEVAQHLKNAEVATIKGGRHAHKLPRRKPRLRELSACARSASLGEGEQDAI